MSPDSPAEVLDADHEGNEYLGRMKQRIVKQFRWTSKWSLLDTADLAFLLYTLGREDEARKTAEFLAPYEFAGNFDLWSGVESALALLARIHRRRRPARARACVARIREQQFVEDRLKGTLVRIYDSHVRTALAAGGKTREVESRLRLAEELCVVIELGGSKKLPVAAAEQAFRANLDRVRELIEGQAAPVRQKAPPDAKTKAPAGRHLPGRAPGARG